MYIGKCIRLSIFVFSCILIIEFNNIFLLLVVIFLIWVFIKMLYLKSIYVLIIGYGI